MLIVIVKLLDKDEKDNKKTDRQKLKYGGSYAPRQTFAEAVLLFFEKNTNFSILVLKSLKTQARRIQIHLFKTKSKNNGKYNGGKHKYTNPKEWAGTRPVGFLWAAPCWWVHRNTNTNTNTNTIVANTNPQVSRNNRWMTHWLFVIRALLVSPFVSKIHLLKTKSKNKYNSGNHKYKITKQWIAEWPVGFLWAAPCCWVHLSQASGWRIFNATQILYCRTNSTYIQCVPHFQSHSLLHQEYQSKSILQKFFIAVQMLQIFNVPYLQTFFFKEMTHYISAVDCTKASEVGNNFPMGPKFFFVVKCCKYPMCATFPNRFKFLLHEIYLSKFPAWKIASIYKKDKQGICLTRTYPQRDYNLCFRDKISYPSVQSNQSCRLQYIGCMLTCFGTWYFAALS